MNRGGMVHDSSIHWHVLRHGTPHFECDLRIRPNMWFPAPLLFTSFFQRRGVSGPDSQDGFNDMCRVGRQSRLDNV
eukprot:651120-Amphidinium_carterae.1